MDATTPPDPATPPSPAEPDPAEIAALRRFNRLWTRRIGLLADGFLGSGPSPTGGRLLHALASVGPQTALGLRTALDLDADHLSRLLAGLESQGLVLRSPHPRDGRQSLFRLSPAGEASIAALDRAAAAAAGSLLGGLDAPTRARLLEAAAVMERLHAAPPGPVILRAHRPGDLGWIVARHGAVYAREHGLGPAFEAEVARICADFLASPEPGRERAWIAERDGRRLGSVLLVRDRHGGPETGRLRLLLVEPAARGTGLGRRLVRECVATARALGYRRLVLGTASFLHAARRLYASEGFAPVGAAAPDAPGPQHGDETWARDL